MMFLLNILLKFDSFCNIYSKSKIFGQFLYLVDHFFCTLRNTTSCLVISIKKPFLIHFLIKVKLNIKLIFIECYNYSMAYHSTIIDQQILDTADLEEFPIFCISIILHI